MRQIFEKIYDLHHWYNAESKSGPGASLRQTKTVRTILPALFKELNIKTILDIPCGDFNWMKDVDLTTYGYCGADIVNSVVKDNDTVYTQKGRQFIWADITTSALPKADLIFCRDCLVHFSFNDIEKAIRNLKKSGSKYLLTTTFPTRSNEDIITGSWRPINLESAPFLFPAPIRLFNENCTEGHGMFTDKSLGLWDIERLPNLHQHE
jgi:hypothetical protein